VVPTPPQVIGKFLQTLQAAGQVRQNGKASQWTWGHMLFLREIIRILSPGYAHDSSGNLGAGKDS
jgi:hypothetical protein